MAIKRLLGRAACEDGAVTVDMVVLTASIIGLMMVAFSAFTNATTTHANLVSDTMESRPVGSGF